jgi:hypothetical protein
MGLEKTSTLLPSQTVFGRSLKALEEKSGTLSSTIQVKLLFHLLAVKPISPDNVCFEINTYEDFSKYGLNACGDYTGYVFILSFQIIIGMIMLNLFVAIVLQGFDKLMKHETSPLKPLDLE